MHKTNLEALQVAAEGLGELRNKVVFVGGSVAELYAKNSNASDIRITNDVDCIIEISSRVVYYQLEEELRTKSFRNDQSEGAPICRWLYKDIKIDVMPTDEKILGFSNKWYVEGIASKIPKKLPNGMTIYIFTVAYYLASKFEAHKNRGGNDLRQSHDFEDIIFIIDNYPDLLKDIKNAEPNLKQYLKSTCQKLLNLSYIEEGIECALPYGSGAERTVFILNVMKDISTIN
ncbi:MAG: hypothetical protein KTR26_19630 [Flammeovirgaceae bacterium]|nr:hypothetical protein [Flammeovirgaceae bacterium]